MNVNPKAVAALQGLTPAADKFSVYTSATGAAMQTMTPAALTVLDDTTVGAMLATLAAGMALTMGAADPGSAVLVMAAGNLGRFVFGYTSLTASTTSVARITFAVEDAVGSSVYVNVEIAQVGFLTGLANSAAIPYGFWVPTGRRYKYTKGGAASTTETLSAHNYVEV